MKTVLVANRGEIAIRVIRTARRMGMRTVAVYSDADAGAMHVRAADTAVRIGPAPAGESYLRRDRIIEAAVQTGAALIHPGYGFLAEDDRFARDCEERAITFVGPPSDVLRVVGDKASARALAEASGVPVFPGYAGDDQTDEMLRAEARRVGFPLLVKPAGGGGGKGMTVVAAPDDLDDALASARRVARAAFDDDRLILERYVSHPRHVEVQVFADAHGNVIHLGERDCSLQRRHQKILEESPAPNLDDEVRRRLHEAGVAFARDGGYVGAGTCEFLVSNDGDIGFIEMNARLQVEHPVTELVTGLDLVELQLRVAQGERLPLAQSDVESAGHAIEVRVYAEDPEGFLPQSGDVLHVRWPATPEQHGGAIGVRVDAGVEEGSEVTTFYDPLLAKIVVHGEDRDGALERLHDALVDTELLGPRTNITFLAQIARHPAVTKGVVTTDWLERDHGPWTWPSDPLAAALARAVAAAAELDRILTMRSDDPWSSLGAWRPGGSSGAVIVTRDGDGTEYVHRAHGSGPFAVTGPDDRRVDVARAADPHGWDVAATDVASGTRAAAVRDVDGRDAALWRVWVRGSTYDVYVGASPRGASALAAHGRIESPLPGVVVRVRVEAGQHVDTGAEIAVVEAMKMEHSIKAPSSGTITAVLCAAGDQVDRGRVLVDFEPD